MIPLRNLIYLCLPNSQSPSPASACDAMQYVQGRLYLTRSRNNPGHGHWKDHLRANCNYITRHCCLHAWASFGPIVFCCLQADSSTASSYDQHVSGDLMSSAIFHKSRSRSRGLARIHYLAIYLSVSLAFATSINIANAHGSATRTCALLHLTSIEITRQYRTPATIALRTCPLPATAPSSIVPMLSRALCSLAQTVSSQSIKTIIAYCYRRLAVLNSQLQRQQSSCSSLLGCSLAGSLTFPASTTCFLLRRRTSNAFYTCVSLYIFLQSGQDRLLSPVPSANNNFVRIAASTTATIDRHGCYGRTQHSNLVANCDYNNYQ